MRKMKKTVKVLHDLVTDEMARGQRVQVVGRFIWLHLILLFRKTWVFNWIEGLTIKAIRHWPGTTECYYYGKYDRTELTFLERYLHEEDLFLDVGSNIGSYSLFCSRKIGCRSVAFEPVPATYAELVDNVERNNLKDQIRTKNCALGDASSVLRFTCDLDMSNHALAEGETAEHVVEVPCDRLDMLVKENDLPKEAGEIVIKMDVEGFEPQAIRGADGLLRSGKINVLIVEAIYNREAIEAEIVERYGYKRCRYDWEKNCLIIGSDLELVGDNFFYIKDPDAVQKRLESAQ